MRRKWPHITTVGLFCVLLFCLLAFLAPPAAAGASGFQVVDLARSVAVHCPTCSAVSSPLVVAGAEEKVVAAWWLSLVDARAPMAASPATDARDEQSDVDTDSMHPSNPTTGGAAQTPLESNATTAFRQIPNNRLPSDRLSNSNVAVILLLGVLACLSVSPGNGRGLAAWLSVRILRFAAVYFAASGLVGYELCNFGLDLLFASMASVIVLLALHGPPSGEAVLVLAGKHFPRGWRETWYLRDSSYTVVLTGASPSVSRGNWYSGKRLNFLLPRMRMDRVLRKLDRVLSKLGRVLSKLMGKCEGVTKSQILVVLKWFTIIALAGLAVAISRKCVMLWYLASKALACYSYMACLRAWPQASSSPSPTGLPDPDPESESERPVSKDAQPSAPEEEAKEEVESSEPGEAKEEILAHTALPAPACKTVYVNVPSAGKHKQIVVEGVVTVEDAKSKLASVYPRRKIWLKHGGRTLNDSEKLPDNCSRENPIQVHFRLPGGGGGLSKPKAGAGVSNVAGATGPGNAAAPSNRSPHAAAAAGSVTEQEAQRAGGAAAAGADKRRTEDAPAPAAGNAAALEAAHSKIEELSKELAEARAASAAAARKAAELAEENAATLAENSRLTAQLAAKEEECRRLQATSKSAGAVDSGEEPEEAKEPNEDTAAAPAAAPAAASRPTPAESDSGFRELFKSLPKDGHGAVSIRDLADAMAANKVRDALVFGDTIFRKFMEQSRAGSRKSVTEDEFVEAMKQYFAHKYQHRVASVPIHEMLARAMADLLGFSLSMETRNFQPLENLKKLSLKARMALASELFEKIKKELVSQVANVWAAAAEYTKQEEEREGAGGKFLGELELGPSLLFDFGMETLLGMPGTKIRESIEREHSSETTFKAWNNGVERTTSPKEQFDKALENGWDGEINGNTYDGKRMCDFMTHDMTKQAKLTKEELVVLRMYTGPMFAEYNNKTLRKFVAAIRKFLNNKYKNNKKIDYIEALIVDSDISAKDVEEAVEYALKDVNPGYVTTLHVLVSAITKLKNVNPLPNNNKVWRGFCGLELPDSMLIADSKGAKGGVELGAMSTSTDKNVALSYIRFTKGQPQLFEIDLNHVNRGADLSWISYFPGEAEVLLPPLCGLEAYGEPRFEHLPVEIDGKEEMVWVKIWPIRVSVNVKGRTIEEHQAARKNLFVKTAEEIVDALTKLVRGFRATDEFKLRARTDVFVNNDRDPNTEKTIKKFEDGILKEMDTQMSTWKAEDPDKFNDTSFFRAVYSGLLDLSDRIQLKMSYWLMTPATNLDAVADLSLKDVRRTGLAKNRVLLEASATGKDKKVSAALEQLKYLAGFAGAKEDLKTLTEGESRLHVACADGNLEAASLLLVAGADPSQRSEEQATPLMLAAAAGSHSICKLLLDAKVDVDAVDKGGETAIYRAARSGSSNTVALLVSCNADVNLAETNGKISPLDVSAYCGNVECAGLLIKAGANVNAQRDNGSTPVYEAAQNGHPEAVKLLIEAKCDVDKADDEGATPVFIAAQNGHTEAVALLIEAKCDVDKAMNDGGTPVWMAAQDNYPEAVKLLIEAKCDVDKANNDGCTPVCIAAQEGHPEAVALLIEAKCDVDKAANDTATPLAMAVFNGRVAVVKQLLAAGADKTVQTQWGTALQMAQKFVKDAGTRAELEALLQ